jgi:hypothetical protein
MNWHQRDLFSKRWRKVGAPVPLEEQIQKAVVELFQWRRRAGVIFFHVPNGGYRFKYTAALLKALGVLPGVADLQFIWSDAPGVSRILFLELKRPGGRQSPAQRQFQLDCGVVYAEYQLADSVDKAIEILESYGLLR